MNTHWESGDMNPRIFNFGTRWRWVVNFRHRQCTPREKASDTNCNEEKSVLQKCT